MNDLPGGPEVITLAGVRERMAAYEEECKRKEKGLPKTKITVFRVEDGGKMQGSFSRGSDHENGAEHLAGGGPEHNGSHDDDKSVGADDLNLEPDEHDPDDSAAFDYSARPGSFRGGSLGDSDEENEKEPAEKTPEQLAKDAKEEEAKNTFTILLEKEKGQALSSSQAPVVLRSFSSLQKRYLSAVAELRPERDVDISTTPTTTQSTINRQKIKAELRKEANRKERFSTLKSSYYAYAKAAQDKRDEVEDICVEEEIEKLEDEVVEEWVDYAEKAVEKVEILVAAKDSGDGDEGGEEGGDEDLAEMEKWREEAKKLKEEANERKQRKAEQEAFRAERKEKAKERAKQRAKYLKKKKEMAEAKKRAEQEAASNRAQEDESERETQEAEEEADAEAAAREKVAELEAEHEAEVAPETAEGAKKKTDRDAKKKSDHDKKKSDHGKKKKKEEKSKDEKKKKDKKKKGDERDDEVDKKEEDHESDGEDAPDEKFPRNLDGSIWKNVLKFWTNKPKSLKEKSSKVIITTIPGSDCFRPTETSGNDNASFYWHKVDGDFDCVVHIKGEFANAYDKAGIMLRVDEKTWMMSGVEYFGEQLNNASCITRGISDWSLAPLPADAKKGCWFCVKRVGNKVESFYSMDTKNWIQTRQGLFTESPTIKVGIATGSPKGEGFKVTFDRFWMKKK